MALLVVPAFCTNLWQGFIGSHLALLSRRLWPLFLAVIPCVWAGAALSDLFQVAILTQFLGGLVIIYAALSFRSVLFIIPLPLQAWLGPLCGAINGVLTGLTGSLFLPGVMYLHAIGLSRDQLVQAMGLLFALSTLALGISLQETAVSMLTSGKFLALHCCQRCLVCIVANSVVIIYQTIFSTVFSCLDWHSLAFILCLVNVNRSLSQRCQ